MATEREIGRARALRRQPTEAEARLWSRLRSGQIEGARFRRQVPIAGYVADFACLQARLVVELDGGQHADSVADVLRTREIEACGYLVLRFWNHDVLANTDGVLEAIVEALRNARP